MSKHLYSDHLGVVLSRRTSYNYGMVIIYIIAAVAAVLLAAAIWSTFSLRTTELEIALKNLPDEFDGCKFVHISDMHNASFGRGNRRLIRRIENCEPEFILVTGDFAGGVSFERPEKGAFHTLLQGLSPYKVYISFGNHELRLAYKHPELLEKQRADIAECGGILLDNSAACIERGGAHINLFGLSVPGERHSGKHAFEIPDGIFGAALKPRENECNVLMAHIPQFFPQYADAGFDLVLSGHVHGGIIRLPLLGGVLSPTRRLFPDYCYGFYKAKNTLMFITAGLGRALVPLRFMCRPEVVQIVLKKAD